jgi:hypothetical protein
MYELSCPSCHAVVNSPFVRVGAAVTCSPCGHRYLIGQAHIKHVSAAARRDPDSQAKPGAQSEQGGIQGLSEMMRVEAERDRDSQLDDYDTIKPAADDPRKPIDLDSPAPSAQVKESKSQKAGRGGYLFAAAAALALAVLGGGVWLVDWDVNSVTTPPPPEQEVAPEPVYDGPVFHGLPLLGSVALEHNPWVQPNKPYQSKPQDDPAVFVADDVLEPSDTGVIEFMGLVVSERDDVILDGELSISLIDRRGIEKAHATVPIALVSKDQSMKIRLPIPASLDPTAVHPAWSITVNESLKSVVLIEDVSMEAESVGSDTMAHIVLANETDQQLDTAELLVTAWDAQGLPLRRWRVHWEMPIAPGYAADFYARTAVTSSRQIDTWTVLAVGEYSPYHPAPTTASEQAD